jgi:RNA polymerase sigma factor (sigma-70 family)
MTRLAHYRALGRQLEAARSIGDRDRVAQLEAQLREAPAVIRFLYLGDAPPPALGETPPPPEDQLDQLLRRIDRGAAPPNLDHAEHPARLGGQQAGVEDPVPGDRLAAAGAATEPQRQASALSERSLELEISAEYIARAARRKAELAALLAPDPGDEPDDAALASDIHQQVFIEAFRGLPGFAGRSTVRTWLFRIAHHRVLAAARRRRHARAHLDVSAGADLPDPRPSADEWLDDAELQAALVACLAALDEPARTAVLLRYQQGLACVARALRAQPELRDLLTQERLLILALQVKLS